MKKEITKYDYNDFGITFSGRDDVMVNATEMAKAFGKQPYEWLRLPSTKEFLETLSRIKNIPITESESEKSRITLEEVKVRKSHFELITTIRGGKNPGTWYHEDVAIEFARWLSPVFAVWCN